jgi:hypothetical protein
MTTTSKEVFNALSVLQELYSKADKVLGSLSNEARDAIRNYHDVDANLVHVARWGSSNSEELLDDINKCNTAYIYDKNEGCLTLNRIELPFKADEFPSDVDRMGAEVIYIPEEAESFTDQMTGNDFIEVIKTALGDLSLYTFGQIEQMADRLWEACEWQSPAALIDELGIDTFKENLPKFVIMVDDKGYWSNKENWVPDVESATKFLSESPTRPITMPSTDWLNSTIIKEEDAVDLDDSSSPGLG